MSRAFALYAVVLLWWGTAGAQSAAAQGLELISLGRFQPAASPRNFIVTERALTLRHLELATAVYLDYANDPLLGATATREIAVVSDRLEGELLIALGLLDRLELGLALPGTLAQSSELLAVDTSAAFGDLRVVPKVEVFEAGPFAVGVRAPFEIPTGDEERFSGHPGLRVVPELLLSAESARFGASVNVGYRWREEAVELIAADDQLLIDHELVSSLGLRIGVVPRRVDLLADATLTVGLEQRGGHELWSELWLALRYHMNARLAATLGGGPGLGDGPGTPAFRLFLSLGLVSPLAPPPEPPADSDGDRIPDARDACPHAAEDYDGHADTDGCPEQEPPADSDGDGLTDDRDACPAEAEDRDGFEDTDGCPDLDDDGDGVPDSRDRCPAEPEDQDDFEDGDGCPDPDNDGDGMQDAVDLCKDEPETKNGFEDDDGCPDALPEAVKKFEGTLRGIVFELNKAEIRPASRPILIEVANAMKEYPSLKVLIRGHTDNRGSADYNQRLSTARAQAVKDFLVGQGVAQERIEAVGLGPNEPIDTNETALGRANNRRIEFRIQSP